MEPTRESIELAEWGKNRYPCRVDALGIAVITGPAVELKTEKPEQEK